MIIIQIKIFINICVKITIFCIKKPRHSRKREKRGGTQEFKRHNPSPFFRRVSDQELKVRYWNFLERQTRR